MTEFFIAVILFLFFVATKSIFMKTRAFRLAYKEIDSFRHEYEEKNSRAVQSFLTRRKSNLTTKLIGDLQSAQDLKVFLSFQAGQINSMLRFPKMISSLLVLIGLLGTISGILMSMKGIDVASDKTLNINEVSKGIELIFGGLDTAFITTFFGIAGTLMLIGFNYYASVAADKLWSIYLPVSNKLFDFFQSCDAYETKNDKFKTLDEDIRQLRSLSERIEELLEHKSKLDHSLKTSLERYCDFYEFSSKSIEKFTERVDKSIKKSYHSTERLIDATSESIETIAAEFNRSIQKSTGKTEYLAKAIKDSLETIANHVNENIQESNNSMEDLLAATTRIKENVAGENKALQNIGQSLNDLTDSMKSIDERLHKVLSYDNRIEIKEPPERKEKPIVTLATPMLFSKRYWSRAMIYCYAERLKDEIASRIESKNKLEKMENRAGSETMWERCIDIKILPGESIEVEDRKKIMLTYPLKEIAIQMKPKDNAQINQPIPATLILSDSESGEELIDVPFEMKVTDFMFDHISRPFVQKFFARTTLLMGAIAIILDKILGLGIKSIYGIPTGEALLAFSGAVHVFHWLQYGKKSNNFDSPK